jgi:predicted ATPase
MNHLLRAHDGLDRRDATAILAAQLLRPAPAQHVLATSQQPLRVDGERVQRIEPLQLALGSDTLDLHTGAVALFVERARAADHRFQGSASACVRQ